MEDIAQSRKGVNFRTSRLATENARTWVKENLSREVARLRYTKATMPVLKRGSRIEKAGDLDWILHHGDYVFVGRKAMAPSQIEHMAKSKIIALLESGRLFLAVEK